MKKTHDVVKSKQNSKGEYLKNKDGKGIYQNFGSIITTDEGYMKIALETMHGTVWLDTFPVREDNQSQPAKQSKHANTDDIDDEIDF